MNSIVLPEEKIFFEDFQFKITNLRFGIKNDYIPIDKITKVEMRFKVWNLVIAFIFLLLCFIFTGFLGDLAVVLDVFGFIWVYWMYTTYSELWITAEDKTFKVAHTSIANGKYLHKVEDFLKEAIQDNKRIQEEEGTFPYTETMKFKQRLKEFE